MGLSSKYWAAIRKNSNDKHEFFDKNTLSSVRYYCEELAVRSDRKTGKSWAAANPVVRFSWVEIKEVEI